MLFKRRKINKLITSKVAYYYEIKPFNQLKDCLNYANYDILYEDTYNKVFIKKAKDILLQVYLIGDFASFLKLNLNDETLKLQNENKKFANNSDLDCLNLENKVILFCFQEKNEQTIKYSQENSMTDETTYKMSLVYDEELLHLEEYVILKKKKRLYHAFLDLMYQGLDAIDLEEER